MLSTLAGIETGVPQKPIYVTPKGPSEKLHDLRAEIWKSRKSVKKLRTCLVGMTDEDVSNFVRSFEEWVWDNTLGATQTLSRVIDTLPEEDFNRLRPFFLNLRVYTDPVLFFNYQVEEHAEVYREAYRAQTLFLVAMLKRPELTNNQIKQLLRTYGASLHVWGSQALVDAFVLDDATDISYLIRIQAAAKSSKELSSLLWYTSATLGDEEEKKKAQASLLSNKEELSLHGNPGRSEKVLVLTGATSWVELIEQATREGGQFWPYAGLIKGAFDDQVTLTKQQGEELGQVCVERKCEFFPKYDTAEGFLFLSDAPQAPSNARAFWDAFLTKLLTGAAGARKVTEFLQLTAVPSDALSLKLVKEHPMMWKAMFSLRSKKDIRLAMEAAATATLPPVQDILPVMWMKVEGNPNDITNPVITAGEDWLRKWKVENPRLLFVLLEGGSSRFMFNGKLAFKWLTGTFSKNLPEDVHAEIFGRVFGRLLGMPSDYLFNFDKWGKEPWIEAAIPELSHLPLVLTTDRHYWQGHYEAELEVLGEAMVAYLKRKVGTDAARWKKIDDLTSKGKVNTAADLAKRARY